MLLFLLILEADGEVQGEGHRVNLAAPGGRSGSRRERLLLLLLLLRVFGMIQEGRWVGKAPGREDAAAAAARGCFCG